MEKKMIAIRVTEEQKEQIESRAGDKSVTQYLIDCALDGGGGFASESEGWLKLAVEKFGDTDTFIEKLTEKVGVSDPLKLFKWLEGELAQHPFAGYTVADISSEGVTIAKDGKQVAISDELGNGGMLEWFYDTDGVALYEVGDVISLIGK